MHQKEKDLKRLDRLYKKLDKFLDDITSFSNKEKVKDIVSEIVEQEIIVEQFCNE